MEDFDVIEAFLDHPSFDDVAASRLTATEDNKKERDRKKERARKKAEEDRKNAEEEKKKERDRKKETDRKKAEEDRKKTEDDKKKVTDEKKSDEQRRDKENRKVNAGIFTFKLFHTAKTIPEAMKALNWISSFVSLDREHYCMLQNALPAVLQETEKSIRKKRDGYFGSFTDSEAYLVKHAALRQMVPFWQNLYYQFGLVAMTLHHALRPSVEAKWRFLVGCCETVAIAAQGILYSGAEDFRERYADDLRMYQDSYNTRHGTLRWFEDDGENYLHVDIRRLDPILTICATRDEKIDKVEQSILIEVFRIEGLTTKEADKHVVALVQAVGTGAPYAELLDDVFRWKWKVNAGAEKTYSRIYEEAMKRCDGMETAPRMMYVEAVNEHRRYDTRGGASIFW
jgi:hypothetical protein